MRTIMKRIKNLLINISYGNRITTVIRIMTGFLLLFSGLFKAADIETFGRTIAQYKILPETVLVYPAMIIPFLELIIGSLLMIGYKIKAASFVSIVLMLMFTVFILINVIRGEKFNCGCFELGRLGIGINETIGMHLVVRDLVFIILYWIVFNAKKHCFSLENYIETKKLKEIGPSAN